MCNLLTNSCLYIVFALSLPPTNHPAQRLLHSLVIILCCQPDHEVDNPPGMLLTEPPTPPSIPSEPLYLENGKTLPKALSDSTPIPTIPYTQYLRALQADATVFPCLLVNPRSPFFLVTALLLKCSRLCFFKFLFHTKTSLLLSFPFFTQNTYG